MKGKHHTVMENYTAADFKSCIAIPFFCGIVCSKVTKVKVQMQLLITKISTRERRVDGTPHKVLTVLKKKNDLLSEAETFTRCSFIICGHSDMLIVCLSVLTFPQQPWNSMKVCHKSIYGYNSVVFFSFLHQIAEIREHVHFISTLAWFCVNFRYSWTYL